MEESEKVIYCKVKCLSPLDFNFLDVLLAENRLLWVGTLEDLEAIKCK